MVLALFERGKAAPLVLDPDAPAPSDEEEAAFETGEKGRDARIL
jgi:hypothetical protein